MLGEQEAVADVLVAINESGKYKKPSSTSTKTLTWSGVLSTQKWTTFYMKVLTRVASLVSIQIRVEFSVPVDSADSQHITDEIRSGLREVALQDDVQLRDAGDGA